jgi:hypothetical protein
MVSDELNRGTKNTTTIRNEWRLSCSLYEVIFRIIITTVITINDDAKNHYKTYEKKYIQSNSHLSKVTQRNTKFYFRVHFCFLRRSLRFVLVCFHLHEGEVQIIISHLKKTITFIQCIIILIIIHPLFEVVVILLHEKENRETSLSSSFFLLPFVPTTTNHPFHQKRCSSCKVLRESPLSFFLC